MPDEEYLTFGPFRADLHKGEVWQGPHTLKLPPKALTVLQYFLTHPSQVLSKEELLQAAWPGTIVSEAALTVCIRELRQALGDHAKRPQYIETMHRRGYRFIAPLTTPLSGLGSQSLGVGEDKATLQAPQQGTGSWQPTTSLVGREAELQQLHSLLDKAFKGEHQIVFVTGEAGIGKTALIEAFLGGIRSWELGSGSFPSPPLKPMPWVAWGQCIEQFGAGEPYFPLLSALGHLGREPRQESLLQVLGQYAPTWLLHLPALVPPEQRETLLRQTAGTTRERMLREITEALEALTATRPLVLVLEDLHWSDPSTLEFLSFLARRRQPARLLILGTYRPVEMLHEGHPLTGVVQELYAHEHCQELVLGPLSQADVVAYLDARFPRSTLPVTLAQELYQRTEGNPLFLTALLQGWIRQGILRECEGCWAMQLEASRAMGMVAESIRQLVARQQEQLTPEDHQVLLAASVAGMEFSAAAVAAALAAETAAVEQQCEHLVQRQQFLRRAGVEEWPDGTLAARYGFLHALYQQVWHEQVTPTQLQQWHVRIGLRKEAAYGQRASEIAVELALHFEQGRDYQRALLYLHQAGQSAIQRSAHQEALSHLTRGLVVLTMLPDGPERTRQETALQVALAVPFVAIKGHGAPEVGQTYLHARELCEQSNDTRQLFPVLMGLRFFYTVRGELHAARAIGEQLLELAQRGQDPESLLEAHYALGVLLYSIGEPGAAHTHFEQSLVLCGPRQYRSHTFLYGVSPEVTALAIDALTLWQLGHPDQAVRRSQAAITAAQTTAHPYSMAYALTFASVLHYFRREVHAVQRRVEALLALVQEHGFPLWLGFGTALQGWAFAEQGQREEGLLQMRQGAAAWRATGAEVWRPYLLALPVETYGKVKQTGEGLALIAEALTLVDARGERFYEAELWRLKGELTLQKSRSQGNQKSKINNRKSNIPDTQAEAEQETERYFRKAIEIARKQQAKSLELRAATSLARLWQSQGKKSEAHQMLSEIYTWFTEGFDTKDLQEAKALLEKFCESREKGHS